MPALRCARINASPSHFSVSHIRLVVVSSALLWFSQPATAGAQERDSLSLLSRRLASIGAVTGYEQRMVDTLLRLLPGAVRDRAGNARLQLGGGGMKRLAVCPLDEPGYVVGSVREDGYLTLRRAPGQVPWLFDQQLEGHRVSIQGRRGMVPGVVAVRSIHLTRGRETLSEAPFTVDAAYVDVGAVSRQEVSRLGVAVLAPVTLAKRPQSYGDHLLAAPVAGRRIACAALLQAVRQSTFRAKSIPPVTVAFAVEQQLAQRGLATLGNTSGPYEETVIVDGQPAPLGSLQQLPDSEASARWPKLGKVTRWSVPVRYSGTAVETASLRDAEALREALVHWIGGDQ